MAAKTLTWILVVFFLAFCSKAQGEEDQQRFPTKDYVLQLDNSNLQEAIDEFPLILVKFYAPWCGHCKHLAPVYSELARNMALSEDGAEIQIADVDCTVSSEACGKHGIRGYPTVKYFIDGEAHQYSGARTHDDMMAWLKSKPLEVRSHKESEEM